MTGEDIIDGHDIFLHVLGKEPINYCYFLLMKIFEDFTQDDDDMMQNINFRTVTNRDID